MVKNIGMNTDFFTIGGNSLSVAQVITCINDKFDIEMSISDMFQNSTVRQQAFLLLKNLAADIEASVFNKLMDMVERS